MLLKPVVFAFARLSEMLPMDCDCAFRPEMATFKAEKRDIAILRQLIPPKKGEKIISDGYEQALCQIRIWLILLIFQSYTGCRDGTSCP